MGKIYLLVEIDQPESEMRGIDPPSLAGTLQNWIWKRLSYENVVRVIPTGETIVAGE